MLVFLRLFCLFAFLRLFTFVSIFTFVCLRLCLFSLRLWEELCFLLLRVPAELLHSSVGAPSG